MHGRIVRARETTLRGQRLARADRALLQKHRGSSQDSMRGRSRDGPGVCQVPCDNRPGPADSLRASYLRPTR
jgi:hypothetical protein